MLLGAMGMFMTKTVAVKMLPFDNKNEFQVIIDMPEGTTWREPTWWPKSWLST